MKVITQWQDIPNFNSDDEEALFWQEHQIDTALLHEGIHKDTIKESTTITLRFDPRMLSQVKRLARSRYLSYQSMMKQWLAERLEQELKNRK